MTTTEPPSRGRARALDVLLGISSLILALGLFYEYVGVYLSFMGETAVENDADIAVYGWTAAFAIATPLVGFILAVIGRRPAVAVAFVAVGALCLVSAFLFSVPQGRWYPQPADNHLPADYRPCYGTTGYCPGG